jgi:hypothetical protein
LKEEEAWNLIRPVCRELDELVKLEKVNFLSGFHNEREGSYKIYLKCSKIHLSSRGIFDKIVDIEYQNNKLGIGFRSNKIPLNLLIDMTNT